MNRTLFPNAMVFVALVALGAGSRLVGAAPNFAAVAAIALFAGFFFSSRLVAIAVPIAAMLISDVVLGFHDPRQMAVVYAMLGLPVLLRTFIKRPGDSGAGRPAMFRVLGATMLCSVAFFMFTNLAVWCFSAMYTHDLAGLARCYTFGLPFFRFTLAGDMAFSGALFATYLLATRPGAHPAAPARAYPRPV